MSATNRENGKRIAKNTILLYIRMIFMMVVGLFTSRVILDVLGVDDYGVYNVVAGFVTMFSFFTSSFGAAMSRFITYELGTGNMEKLKRIFSTCVNVQIIVSVFIVILAETAGLWFLNTQLNIPEERMFAANWVFQFAVISFIINLISVPYNASIIAHEHMNAFAYISILEVILKLAIVYMLYISPFDKLITYSILFAAVALLVRVVYGIYCKRRFEECTYHMVLDRQLLKEISGFAGWNLLGSGAYLFNTQGVNIITNIYFGVAFNAARGVATQVEHIVRQFVTNFTTALNPQITKSYAAGNLDYMFKLITRGAKYSYLLMLVFTIPFLYEADIILSLWLKVVPEQTALFLRLTFIGTLFDILGNSMAHACWATGKLKRYYIWVGSIGACVFFTSWFLFYLGMPAYTSYIVFAVIYFILIFVKLYIIKGLIEFPVSMYIREVFLRIIPVTVLSLLLPMPIYLLMSEGILRLIILSIISVLSSIWFTYMYGLEASEKAMFVEKAKSILNKLKK